MKKLIFTILILTTHHFIQTKETISETDVQNQEVQNQDKTFNCDENDDLITKNKLQEALVFKILQDENQRLTQEIQIQKNYSLFIQGCIFTTGAITGLLLGIIIHLQLRIDHTDSMFEQFFGTLKYAAEIKKQSEK